MDILLCLFMKGQQRYSTAVTGLSNRLVTHAKLTGYFDLQLRHFMTFQESKPTGNITLHLWYGSATGNGNALVAPPRHVVVSHGMVPTVSDFTTSDLGELKNSVCPKQVLYQPSSSNLKGIGGPYVKHVTMRLQAMTR
jgi:hypothetical protein